MFRRSTRFTHVCFAIACCASLGPVGAASADAVHPVRITRDHVAGKIFEDYEPVVKTEDICTGGGASLEFLEGKVLPGVAALDDR